MLKGKHIVLGITGSIAAYKACTIIRLLVKAGAEVQVVITPAGKEFITSTTLSTLSSKPVISHFFAKEDGTWHSHVDLGLWADAMLIAPATAATLGKMANGVADNMLITTYLSMKAPVFIAPAMDLDMFAHPSTKRNLAILKSYGNTIIEPKDGALASGLIGKGRMEEPEEIVKVLQTYFQQGLPLKGKEVLITAGPTYEKIDPVRFIGNYSSGKMGFALAEQCAKYGAKVKLIAGPTSLTITSEHIERIDVESAEEMHCEAQKYFPKSDVAILCAAVADYTPCTQEKTKIHREKEAHLTLSLQATTDIAESLGKQKQPHQLLIGFALETEQELERAKAKLQKKNLDYIVLNSLNDEGAGFQTDTNKITIIDHHQVYPFPLKLKKDVAKDIINFLCEKYSLS